MSDAYPKGLDVQNVGETTVVRFKGKRLLDEEYVHFIDQLLNNLVEEHDCKKMLLNLQDVECLSSAGLAKLIILQRKKNARFSLCNIAPPILEVFATTKLDKAFRIDPYPDPDEDMGAVPSSLKPPKPSGGGKVSLPIPPPGKDD